MVHFVEFISVFGAHLCGFMEQTLLPQQKTAQRSAER